MRGYPKAEKSITYVPLEIFKFWPINRGNIILYDGPSQLNGTPIVVVAGASTSNRKTGPMVQIWILTRDVDPIAAVKSGADSAICGDCKFRGPGGGVKR